MPESKKKAADNGAARGLLIELRIDKASKLAKVALIGICQIKARVAVPIMGGIAFDARTRLGICAFTGAGRCYGGEHSHRAQC